MTFRFSSSHHGSGKDSGWNSLPLLVVLCAMVLAFILWANFARIEQQVHAAGRIVPASQAKTVQHLEGGIIEKILVIEGTPVEKGTPLLQLLNQKARSERDEIRLSIEALKLKRARLEAEKKDAKEFVYDVPIPDELQDTLESEKSLFQNRTSLLKQKIAGLSEQISQKTLKLEDLKSQHDNLSAERAVAQEQLAINARLRKSGALSETRYLASVSNVKNFDTRIDQIRKTYPITKAEIEEIKKNIDAETTHAKSEIADEMAGIELKINQSSERLKTSSDEVSRTQIVSPVKGIVNKVYMTTIGGVVRPGEPIFEVTPFDEHLIVEARVNTKDRGDIWVGLPARVKVTAYDYAIHGSIDGKLTEISADSISDEKGNRYYRVRVALDSNQLDGKPLFPGMTVDASILTGDVTVMQAILKPLFRLRDNAFQ